MVSRARIVPHDSHIWALVMLQPDLKEASPSARQFGGPLADLLDDVETYRRWVATLRPDDEPVGLFIVKTPGVVGGRARIDNTRLTVWGLAEQLSVGGFPTEIAKMYPHVEPKLIYAALRYYAENPEEIEADNADNDIE